MFVSVSVRLRLRFAGVSWDLAEFVCDIVYILVKYLFVIGPVSGSRYMARLRATGADLGLDIKNNIQWMTVVTSD